MDDIEKLIPEAKLAAQTGNQTTTLAAWRVAGRGPAYVKIGRKVFYRPDDVATWLAKQRRVPMTPAMRRA
jgi:hypothetical protein